MTDVAQQVMDLAKRRGFLWPSYEVYGGVAGFYDYGPLGAAMKARFEELWRHVFGRTMDIPMVEIACPRVTPYDVLKASGHVDEFTDLVVRCGEGHPSRADHLVEEAGFTGNADALTAAEIDAQIVALSPKCPVCGNKKFDAARPLNLMNATEIGPGSERVGYLRPETAQGIFTDFPLLIRHMRGKLPFGATQIGGSNRNEISPRQGMLRLREFHMMEAEVFFADTDAPFAPFGDYAATEVMLVPNSDEVPVTMTLGDAVSAGTICNEALGYFMAKTQEFLLLAGMNPAKLRFRQHLDTEMAHYANDCWDAEFYSDRYGWVECVGIADRGCYDLQQHATHAGKFTQFSVSVPIEPITVTATKYEPVMSQMGRAFKQQAKVMSQAMEDAFAGQLLAAGVPMDGGIDALTMELVEEHDAPSELTLTVDGEAIEVPPECFTATSGTWRITETRQIPRVIEPSFGVDRILWALWEHAYQEEDKNGETYVRLQLSPNVAPMQIAILPLTAKDGMPEKALAIEMLLRNIGLRVESDASGNIGRRYARQDEVGTPFCVTVDDVTLQDDTVTVRMRNDGSQERLSLDDLPAFLQGQYQL